MLSKRNFERIPLNDVQAGLETSKNRGLQHINDARTLLMRDRIHGSALMTIFSLEELGRMLILKDRYQKSITKGIGYIEIKKIGAPRQRDAFYDHKKKQDRAKKILPPGTLKIHQAAFEAGTFTNCFDIYDTFLNKDLRDAVNYVNYCNGKWQDLPFIDVDKLKNCINEIEKAIQAQV